MTNHKSKNRTAKSKLFLIILCILGLAFSYSCSCRDDNPYSPNTPTGGDDTTKGNTITPSFSLSRESMIINSDGTTTSKAITITVEKAEIKDFEISGEGFIKDNFELKSGTLSLKEGFGNVDTTGKDITLTIIYEKKSDAGADDKLTKPYDTKTFKVIKAQKIDVENTISYAIKEIGSWFQTGVPIIDFSKATLSGTTFTVDARASDNSAGNDYDTITVGKDFFGSDRLLSKLKADLKGKPYYKNITYAENKPNGDNQVFYYNLDVTDTYELEDTRFGIEIKNLKHSTGNNFAIKWTE